MALAHKMLAHSSEWVISMLLAFNKRPTRAEPLWRLVHHYRLNNQPELAMMFATSAIAITYPSNDYFYLEHPVYRCAIREELAISGHSVNNSHWRAMGRAACFGLSADPACPAHGKVAALLQHIYSAPLKVIKLKHSYCNKTKTQQRPFVKNKVATQNANVSYSSPLM